MDYLKGSPNYAKGYDPDDDCPTEATEKVVRNTSGYYFDMILDIMEFHTKKNLET